MEEFSETSVYQCVVRTNRLKRLDGKIVYRNYITIPKRSNIKVGDLVKVKKIPLDYSK